MRRLLLLSLLLFTAVSGAHSQPLVDTLFTWEGYARQGITRVQLYPGPPEAEERTRTVIIRELARSHGPVTVYDAQYLAEAVGRQFGFDPTTVYWVFYWGSFSYEGATGGNDLFLRATFNRTDSGRLSSPYWTVVTKAEVRELTDRRFRE